MSKQLSLFHTLEQHVTELGEEAGTSAPETEASALDELFRTKQGWRGSREYIEILDFVSRFPAYSPLNGFLIFVQNPEATFVATGKAWLKKYDRQLKPGAHPIVILAPMSPVLFVFDIRDTEGPPLASAALQPATTMDRLPPKIYETTLHNCSRQHIAVRETADMDTTAERALRITPAIRKKYADLSLAAGLRYAILLDADQTLEEKYAALVVELGHLFCGHLGIDGDAWWADRKELDLERIDIEAASVAYLVCRRRRLAEAAKSFLSEYRHADRGLPPFSLNAVFQAAGHIESMGKVLRQLRKQSRS
jgi:hypothetical protein